MGEGIGQVLTAQPIGCEQSAEMTSSSTDSVYGGVLTNTPRDHVADPVMNTTLPSQIPCDSLRDMEIGSSVDDTYTDIGQGPWTSTQRPAGTDESNDRQYGVEHGDDVSYQTDSQPSISQSASFFQDSQSLPGAPDSRNEDMLGKVVTNFSVGENFTYYANASSSETNIDSAMGAPNQPGLSGQSGHRSRSEKGWDSLGDDAMYGSEGLGDASENVTCDTVDESEKMMCKDASKVRSDVQSEQASVSAHNTHSENAPTAHTSKPDDHTQYESRRMKGPQMGQMGQNPFKPKESDKATHCRDNPGKSDRSDRPDSDENPPKTNGPSVQEMTDLKYQMGNILQALGRLTDKMTSNHNQQTASQDQTQHALNVTQQTLETNKQETQKTQKVIDNMHQDILRAHQDIRTNQNKTQQAFQATNSELMTMNEKVTKTLETLTVVQNEIRETKNDVETNKKSLHDTKSEVESNKKSLQESQAEISKNKEEIQTLKKEMKGLRDKQMIYDRQQEQQEQYNERNDKQKDRQEVLNRRNNVVFYGIPEKNGRGRERTDEVVIETLQQYMPDGDWKDSDCTTAYRAGRRQYQQGNDKPRPIIATFDKTSDVAFILKSRQAREDMKHDGYGCGQDLTRAQKQTIYDLKASGKHAYYTRGRLVVRDPHFDYRSRSKQENEDRYRHRHDIQRDNQSDIQDDRSLDRVHDRQGTYDTQRQHDRNPTTQSPDFDIIVDGSDPQNIAITLCERDQIEQDSAMTASADPNPRTEPSARAGNANTNNAPPSTQPTANATSNADSRELGSDVETVSSRDDANPSSSSAPLTNDPDKRNQRQEQIRTFRSSYKARNQYSNYARQQRPYDRLGNQRRAFDHQFRFGQNPSWKPNRPQTDYHTSHVSSPRPPPRPPYTSAPFASSVNTQTSAHSTAASPPTPPMVPSFAQFQQLHNFFTNINRFFQPPPATCTA